VPVKRLKKFLPTAEQIRNEKSLQFLGQLLHDPNLWHMNRYSVSGAFGIGLFVAYMPIPFQSLPAALLAIAFRVNLPIAIMLVWVSNPLTIPPMFYMAYEVGAKLTGADMSHFRFEPTLDWLFLELGARWRPFLAGCLFMGSLLGLAGFFGMQLLWRLHLLQRIKERKLLRNLGINRFTLRKDKAEDKTADAPVKNQGDKSGSRKTGRGK
jgi:uncharacterized protein (DUF2062 family)